MNPINFPEARALFHPPRDLDESQCSTVPAYVGNIVGGNLDGLQMTVVCWELTHEELAALFINKGKIFLTMLGGLAPHCLTLSFEEAINIGK